MTARRRFALLLSLAALVAMPLAAQGTPRALAGTVTRPGAGNRQLPVPGVWVVLHRVGVDAANPIDSMRTRGDGTYAFEYRATGDTNAVYFVSASRGGIAYFTPPTREARVRGGMADLQVFDTTSGPVPITVRGRHVIVTAPDTAQPVRTVIEVYELSNDSSLTRVPGAGQVATFEAPLPAGVTEVIGGQGDISPDAVRADEGRVRVWAPISPGLKQFSFSYVLPLSQTELSIALEQDVPVMEVLVEDPRGSALGAGLTEVDPVQVDGRPFKRFLAQDLKAPATVTISAPGTQDSGSRTRLLLIVTAVGAAMLLGFGMAIMRRGPDAFARRREPTPEALAAEIAALDAAYDQLAAPTEEQKAEHYLKRAQLKGRLSAVLAKRDGLA
ncbi:hypothetical protein Strain138_001331 [Pseudogemmatithrix spongiicola]|uniref:Carboxypeptidase regulatory-like domain-containing protein n=1 Tax=Pseudogemmatithrix spongiicola TaxID=3062599 RepID=A0AA49Q4S7_9BACT|nr:hypothetical protein Strain138_001331 [Gemmatimonadaceae bacterium 'strain 138']WKW14968.1 hypothetical protein Strain318_001331 [Gemmatimonadaceae bacterium 'strain 318']